MSKVNFKVMTRIEQIEYVTGASVTAHKDINGGWRPFIGSLPIPVLALNGSLYDTEKEAVDDGYDFRKELLLKLVDGVGEDDASN